MADLLLRNVRLATLAGGVRRGAAMNDLALRDGVDVRIVDGRIAEIGPEVSGDGEDCGGRLLTPGLIDVHTHLIFGGCRAGEFAHRCQGATYEQIAAAGGGIRSTLRQTAECDDLVAIGRKHLDWMLANGTTTLEAKSGYAMTSPGEIAILEAYRDLAEQGPQRIVPTLLGLHAVPVGMDREAWVAEVCDHLIPEVARRGLAKYVDAFVEQGYFTLDDARLLALAAGKAGLGMRLHVDQLTAGGGAELAVSLGASTADHLEQTGRAGIAALADSKTMPVLLPASVYALRKSKYPDARAMIDAGLPVVLATDFNPGSSPTPSLLFVMNLACVMMGMSPAEALSACTINAAASLGLDTGIGSIEVGKRADLVLWDADDPAQIAYWIGAPLVKRVWIGGSELRM
ncbi:MAG: imidazolonepropionase [Methanoregulaceae archaeon]|nr:imidazolonepropionase [Methanoregulaceae archaeon]